MRGQAARVTTDPGDRRTMVLVARATPALAAPHMTAPAVRRTTDLVVLAMRAQAALAIRGLAEPANVVLQCAGDSSSEFPRVMPPNKQP